ncbi:DUF3213 domain-containing protein [Thermococcus atlanticus]
MLKLRLKFRKINPVDAMVKQYELLNEEGIYRAFINGYSRRGSVVFDESRISREEIMKRLEDFEPEIVGAERLTLDELIESSYSWKGEAEV